MAGVSMPGPHNTADLYLDVCRTCPRLSWPYAPHIALGMFAMILQCLLHMPQFGFAVRTAESTEKVRKLGQNWGMYSKHCNTMTWGMCSDHCDTKATVQPSEKGAVKRRSLLLLQTQLHGLLEALGHHETCAMPFCGCYNFCCTCPRLRLPWVPRTLPQRSLGKSGACVAIMITPAQDRGLMHSAKAAKPGAAIARQDA